MPPKSCAPLNRIGDEEGCTATTTARCRTPNGFKHAYDQFREGGWTALTAPEEFGGQGLPPAVGFAVRRCSPRPTRPFSMYPGLSHGAYARCCVTGSDEQKTTYLPKLIAGTWTGTMCLTEPHCGTDLGMLRTKAEPQADGSYTITGTKIFISAGEHDLTENIIHLVLARLPDAPDGTQGHLAVRGAEVHAQGRRLARASATASAAARSSTRWASRQTRPAS